MSGPDDSRGGPVRRFAGMALIVVGALWMAAAGLCSLGFFVSMLFEGLGFREAVTILPMIAFVGGFGAGIGLVIYVVGRALRRKA